ncbi:MAG: sugar kinase, partial [Cytophagaceae bacterium]
MGVEYAIIVKNKTRLEALNERFNTQAQSQFYIERLGGHFEDYVLEHDTFHKSLATLQKRLSTVVKHKIVDRAYVSSFLFSEK